MFFGSIRLVMWLAFS
ncbi:hypothetical protein OIU79_016149 [Salix purpurea]|uniref:Uncharacterized protein n=1 Tax=Salix purpurea TaxID=77065 RepID=A0A9Q0PDM1_SALPP|nr:hypothetical protein OIU79_016149 [Salix purpurea]